MIFERVVLNNNKKSLEALNDSPEYFKQSVEMSFLLDL